MEVCPFERNLPQSRCVKVDSVREVMGNKIAMVLGSHYDNSLLLGL